jgi:ubiquinone/menaquinone biosynthesis C-methylase UbiE
LAALPRLAHPGERDARARRRHRHGGGRDRARPRRVRAHRRRRRPEHGDAGRARVEGAGLRDRIELSEGRAESLPFADDEFDALTVTYLLRYVGDPVATMRELARVVRPGGVLAMLEFGLPRGVWRPLWDLYVRVGLPLAGAAVSPGWHEVGRFLGPSIRGFHERYSLEDVWREAGIGEVRTRTMSLGGGVVVWGTS